MDPVIQPWVDLWDYLDGNFWGVWRWAAASLGPEEVAWQPTMKIESPPPAEERPPRRPRRRFRPKRRPVPWAFLIVGLLVGLASIGLFIVLIVALWPSN